MDFEYVRHMFVKYRIAIAIAVIKSKPETMSIDEYILHLQKQLDKSKSTEANTFSVCSDDFDFDDVNTQTNSNAIEENCMDLMNEDVDSNDSLTILHNLDVTNFEENCDVMTGYETREVNESSNVFKMLREIDRDSQDIDQHTITIPSNFSQTFCESLTQAYINDDIHTKLNQDVNESLIIENIEQIDNIIFVDKNVAGCNTEMTETFESTQNVHIKESSVIDSQATQIYTIPDYTQNFTHVSQSQDNLIIAEKYIKSKTRNVKDISFNKDTSLDHIENVLDTEFSQNSLLNEIFSQKNMFENVINRKDEHNQKISEENDTDNISKINNKDVKKTVSRITNDIHNIYQKEHTKLNDATTKKQETEQVFNSNILLKANDNVKDSETITTIKENKTLRNITENTTKVINMEIDTNALSLINNNINENSDEDIDVSQAEVVPFKVIEELSKIKSFLYKNGRTDGYSTDSGYKSDSQLRCSLKSGGTSGSSSVNWVNQSAHSLFEYITRCPLVGNTHDITGEISQILGEVIDKLHEDEQYPSFLEELLETVGFLVDELFRGTNDDSVQLIQDEIIQRICLLNKSCHILKFTIEKLTIILETLHENLTNKEALLEINNINQLENSSYIMHVLQILLQRYLKVKDTISQSSQPSQDEKLRKNSITEIWRRKWNTKTEVEIESSEKECAMTRCCGILNKIIVDCIGGYSLVAYAALQCFNLIQS